MGVILNQCMEIINLVSLDWKSERFAIVAHSFRVMAKARNFDEMVVGMMHEVYGASSYARGLFSCDVNHAYLWEDILDLFVPRTKVLRKKIDDEIIETDLLEANRPQDLAREKIAEWMLEETKWSDKYRRWIDRFVANRTARNVMIYDLEDKLDILQNPGKYEQEYGPQYFVLPWKKHYLVDIRIGRHGTLHERVPLDDDKLLLRPLSDLERKNLIKKYTRGLERLKKWAGNPSHPEDYSIEEQESNREKIMLWLGDWIAQTIAFENEYGNDDDLPI